MIFEFKNLFTYLTNKILWMTEKSQNDPMKKWQHLLSNPSLNSGDPIFKSSILHFVKLIPIVSPEKHFIIMQANKTNAMKLSCDATFNIMMLQGIKQWSSHISS